MPTSTGRPRRRSNFSTATARPTKSTPKASLATCIQHEIDHLNGVLFVDHLSSVRRSIILRKLTKAKRLAAAE